MLASEVAAAPPPALPAGSSAVLSGAKYSAVLSNPLTTLWAALWDPYLAMTLKQKLKFRSSPGQTQVMGGPAVSTSPCPASSLPWGLEQGRLTPESGFQWEAPAHAPVGL